MTEKLSLLAIPLLAISLLDAAPAIAFDGWHLVASTPVASNTAGWDYIAYDSTSKKLFLGHRKEGLQIFDPATQKLLGVVGDTPAHSANGATFAPEFDLGISNNEDGTYTPFKLSRLEQNLRSSLQMVLIPATMTAAPNVSSSIPSRTKTAPI